jgi:hypothetical protein
LGAANAQLYVAKAEVAVKAAHRSRARRHGRRHLHGHSGQPLVLDEPQMMRVISSPSSTTTGVFTLILAIPPSCKCRVRRRAGGCEGVDIRIRRDGGEPRLCYAPAIRPGATPQMCAPNLRWWVTPLARIAYHAAFGLAAQDGGAGGAIRGSAGRYERMMRTGDRRPAGPLAR